MALDVATYPKIRQAVVHRVSCHIWTTAPRVRQVEPVVIVEAGWLTRGCSLCRPVFGVVTLEHWRVLSRGEEMVRRFKVREGHRRVSVREVDVPQGTVEHQGWKRWAACRSSDARLNGWLRWLFLSESGLAWQTDVQKAVCRTCPVQADCLIVGVWGGEEWGVWGGATVRERRVLLKKWKREGRIDGRLVGPSAAAVG